MWFLGLITGSKIGRRFAAFLVGLFLFWVIVRQIMERGARSERLRRKAQSLDTLKRRMIRDAELDRLGADERRRRLREWARADG
ncbi:putative DedA family protein [Roseibium sp. TrichSKD4]|uniref:hypothetical protein n=1 Tax=Roseibium sp. TrichSKD4 TaxID=744980 RepID=UPI0001E57610|nr:hypothetical protein [Roseibium sp. TrichSKD4]EFO30951.1 putative DedA family protein [Roseibium sp. TrichSKD4]